MSINTTISLYNQMSPILSNVVNSMNMVISTAQSVEMATGDMLSTSSLDVANKYIQEAGAGIAEMENQLSQAAQEQENLNRKAKEGHSAFDGLIGKAKTLLATYLGFKGVSLFTDTSDDFSLMNSRLAMINDGTMTFAQLQNEAYLIAQRSRTPYMDTLDVITKIGMQAGHNFKNTAEILVYVEQLNKELVIAGTSAQGVQSVMYNLTQALATGYLRGQDFNAVMQNAPNIIKKMADYMGVTIDQMRDLAADGELAADVIIYGIMNANAISETNEKLKQMAYTWGQLKQTIKDSFLNGLLPAFQQFSSLINSERFEQFTINIMKMGETVAGVIEDIVSGFITAFNFIYDNSEVLIPAFATIIGLLIAWKVQTQLLTAENIALMKSFATSPITWAIILVGVLSELLQYFGLAENATEALGIAMEVLAYGVFAVSAAFIATQIAIHGFSTALMATPIGWILALIGAVIFLIYRWIQSIGGVQIAWKTMVNWILTKGEDLKLGFMKMTNSLDTFRENALLGMADIKNGILYHVGEMRIKLAQLLDIIINNAIDHINEFIEILNKLPFVEIEMIGKVNNEATRRASEEALRQQREQGLKEQELTYSMNQMAREDAINNYSAQILGNQTARTGEINRLVSENESLKNAEQTDFNSLFGNGSDIYNMLGDISANTKGIDNKLDWENDDLSSLKDLMEQRAVTELSKEIKLEVHNEFTGNIDSKLDMKELADEVSETILDNLTVELNA